MATSERMKRWVYVDDSGGIWGTTRGIPVPADRVPQRTGLRTVEVTGDQLKDVYNSSRERRRAMMIEDDLPVGDRGGSAIDVRRRIEAGDEIVAAEE